MKFKPLFILSICLLVGTLSYAQKEKVISGTILSQQNNEPLIGASVYLNGTTIGNFSEANGTFKLPYNPSFTQLVVSYLGYSTITYNIQEGDWNKKLKIIMEAEAEELKTVNISSTRTKAWQNNLNRFKSEFIGYSKFAEKTTILNPEVLYFEKDKGTKILKAFARQPLRIENKALGYIIEYDLEAFSYQSTTGRMQILGYSKFTKLEGSKSKVRRWIRNQKAAYYGSFAHFIHTLQNNELKKSNYKIQLLKRIPNPERPSDEEIEKAKKALRTIAQATGELRIDAMTDSLHKIIKKRELPRSIAMLDKNAYDPSSNITLDNDNLILAFPDYWQISFSGENVGNLYAGSNPLGKKPQISIISLTTPEAIFDQYGIPQDPLSILFEGYWPYEKTPYLLPLDYIQAQAR